MAVKEKEFNTKLYAVITFFVVAAILVVTVVTTFNSKYIAFHPDEVAQIYVDNIVQDGDGYDAYKYTLVSKNGKYGDFIRKNYMYSFIYEGYKLGDDTSKLKGLNDDKLKSDATLNDDGTLSGKVSDTMYKYYVQLVDTCGWDDYDTLFTEYFTKLVEVREKIFGDKYLSDEVMFTALESNVATYSAYLNGSAAIFDPYEKEKVLVEAKDGIYDKMYGEDYKITCTTTEHTELTKDEVVAHKAKMDSKMLEVYGVKADDIVAIEKCVVTATLADNTEIASQEVYVVKIGKSWYVDNTTVDTSALYIAQ